MKLKDKESVSWRYAPAVGCPPTSDIGGEKFKRSSLPLDPEIFEPFDGDKLDLNQKAPTRQP
jgi:hypothetical protein